MPQPDSGDNCCDCPSRTGPCDDCGGGACCVYGVCSILSQDDCNTASGHYFGDGTDCDPDPCIHIGCCLQGELCQTFTSIQCASVGGIFVGDPRGTFCWPAGDTSGFGIVSCCFPGDNRCIGGNGLDYFCCTPPNICCSGTESGIACCSPEQTCCQFSGNGACCDNATEECCSEDGCCPIGFCVDGFCTG